MEPAGKCEYMWTMSSEPLNEGFFPVSDSDFIGNAVLKMKGFPFI